jgi:hypothetical protein
MSRIRQELLASVISVVGLILLRLLSGAILGVVRPRKKRMAVRKGQHLKRCTRSLRISSL